MGNFLKKLWSLFVANAIRLTIAVLAFEVAETAFQTVVLCFLIILYFLLTAFMNHWANHIAESSLEREQRYKSLRELMGKNLSDQEKAQHETMIENSKNYWQKTKQEMGWFLFFNWLIFIVAVTKLIKTLIL